jgi:hypothetical protein
MSVKELPFSSFVFLGKSLPSTKAQIPWLFLPSFNNCVSGIVLRNNGEQKQQQSLPDEASVPRERHHLHLASILPTPTGKIALKESNVLTFSEFRTRVQIEV